MKQAAFLWSLWSVAWFLSTPAFAQSLEQSLLAEGARQLAAAARDAGDAARGAVVFHQPYLACAKCHSVSNQQTGLGPTLSRLPEDATDAHLVESILAPSQVMRKEYQPRQLVLQDGRQLIGLVVREDDRQVVLRDAGRAFAEVTVPRSEIETMTSSETSLMPAGQMNALSSRQQFLDLVRYLIEIRDGGPSRARELQPPSHLIAPLELPAYEREIDHAGMIRDLDVQSLARGRETYQRLCINCHGTHDRPGSLPTSLRFASGKFKNGSDPFAMYQTLSRGFGLMAPQTWMVPQQKYDVVHYIRETYLKQYNPTQYFTVDANYLAGLPPGTSRGPAPRKFEPWIDMDYGPLLANTYEVGSDASNFAYKGLAVRLDAGPGGVSRGHNWIVYDHDTLRLAAAWTRGENPAAPVFIDWRGIQFDGQHQVHPRVSGQVLIANPTGPGWANPETGTFDDPRLRGRDNRPYGPLPKSWARFKGTYAAGTATILSYDIGNTAILESPGLYQGDNEVIAAIGKPIASAAKPMSNGVKASEIIFTRTFNIAARDRDLLLIVATHADDAASLTVKDDVAIMGASKESAELARSPREFQFDGHSWLERADAQTFDMTDHDFTVTARICTREDGSIFAQTGMGPQWAPDGKTLFIRGGRLAFDIGWVGVVSGNTQIDDGKWHDVALAWTHEDGIARLFVDGKPDGSRPLRPKQRVGDQVIRVGFTSPNFPRSSYWKGKIAQVRFYQRLLSEAEIRQAAGQTAPEEGLVAAWTFSGDDTKAALDVPESFAVRRDAQSPEGGSGPVVAGLSIPLPGSQWEQHGRRLCLRIPRGQESLRFMLCLARGESSALDSLLKRGRLALQDSAPDLTPLITGGPPRWPERLITQAQLGPADGPFVIDVLTLPTANPWLAQMRVTGLDFFSDGDRMAACTWDGDVWLVTGLSQLDAVDSNLAGRLTWQRIASGLFQPLGLKIIQGRIYLTCRDQIVILNDLNGDGETDFYECFNDDHQVTEHFHEFAMGLQVDAAGNLYYAKSARHALPALVPHHGTLLKVAADGSQTEIVATGFRAANGVCLNPDGTFVVTDQEGHWNPKNRINWVKPGGFYGNMFGYHNMTDSSDSAMQQPLCWITNSFDRSPAELLWVDSPRWGPLRGSLLNLSYGYGKVYIVPHEEIDGQKQGGMCELPIPQFPTGIMRGRFHPLDGQLYLGGMFAWGGNQQQPGGLYRLRYTGKPTHLPLGLHATRQGMSITFSDPVDRASAEDPGNYSVKVWSLKRSATYGSQHYDENRLRIKGAQLADDGRTVLLKLPELEPTWCMEIRYDLKSSDDQPISGMIHNTVHRLRD